MRKRTNGTNYRVLAGLVFLTLGVIGLFYVWYSNSSVSTITRTFSTYTILTGSWERYKQEFINTDGRVMDDTLDGITTSEGQSYAMLRAVWIDDKEMFDKVWQFTKDNLQHDDDNLFGWKWGSLGDDNYGFLPDGGENSASDADSDIALALIFAGRRWGDQNYINEARDILEDLWEINTVEIDSQRYLLAGNWANYEDEIVMNPSYFAPYAYKIFEEVDDSKDWASLVDTSYEILEKSSHARLEDKDGVGLPPDWVAMNKETKALSAPNLENLSTNYSYDAIRVPFRVALDLHWFNEEKAQRYFESSLSLLKEDYKTNRSLSAMYSHSGERLADYESPSMYAMSLGYFMNTDSELAREIYQQKVIELYSNGVNAFNEDLPYYEQNLLWFGVALYNDQLIKI